MNRSTLMDATEFRKFGRAAVDFVADYVETVRDRPVLPAVEPGYLQKLIPSQAPQTAESWEDVMKDLQRVIVPGITHWHSPNFHGFFPTGNSYPSIVGDIMSAGLGCIGLNWISSPACTELEMVMMDWLVRMLALPEEFLNSTDGPGGGVIQNSASEATLLGLLVAKERTVRLMKARHPDWNEQSIKGRLVAYTSDQSNSSVEKAGLLGSMTLRLLPTDHQCRLRGDVLEKAILSDREEGLIPCYVIATLGTTGTCAFDCLEELGPICQREDLWLHVDAAYAGLAFACPEFRHLMTGVEYADSFNFNPHKWMMVHFDCSALWLKDARHLVSAFNVQRTYLAHENQKKTYDYRDWQISLGRRFRSLKLWFVLRIYGVQGIQDHVRRQVALAHYFEDLVRPDRRFEITAEVILGLVCFRLKGPDHLTKELLDRLTRCRRIFVVSGMVFGTLIIRFAICSRNTEKSDIDFAWHEISSQADWVLSTNQELVSGKKITDLSIESIALSNARENKK